MASNGARKADAVGGMLGGPPMGTVEIPGRSPAVLALHGFGATPQEVFLAVEVAQELGLRARAPLLPGHGTSVQALAATGWADWRSAAEEAFLELSAGGDGVIVVGCSMGSLLALDLAADHPDDVSGLVVLACATHLSFPFPSLALALVQALRIPDFTIPKSAPDIRDAAQRRTQVTYSAQPAWAGNEVRRAGRRVLGRLGEVRAPALIAHGRLDHVCPVANARQCHARLGTVPWEKELLILPRSFHIVTRDVERGALRSRLHAFLSRVAGVETAESLAAQAPVEP